MRRIIAVALLAVGAVGACGPSASPSAGDADAGGGFEGPWRPTPMVVAPALLPRIDAACRASMPDFPAAAQLVAVDARGAGRLQAAFSGPGGEQAMCADMTIDAAGNVQALGGGSTSQAGAGGPLLRAAELSPQGTMMRGGEGDRIISTVTIGKAGPGIAGVVVDVPGQPRITATLANGWYLVWWPGAWPAGTKVIGLDPVGAPVANADP